MRATYNKEMNRKIYEESAAYLREQQFGPQICEAFKPALQELENAISERLRTMVCRVGDFYWTIFRFG